MTTTISKHIGDYDKMSEEAWDESVEQHVGHLNRRMKVRFRETIVEYMLLVFGGVRGETELRFVADVLDKFRAQFPEDWQEDLSDLLDMK